jgi:hypothetical protein
LRVLDYPYPLWQFELTYSALGDNLGQAGSAGAIGTLLATDLRTLMGFFLACQGAFSTFLYLDPTDNAVIGQVLPAAISTYLSGNFYAPGSGYLVGDVIAFAGGVLAAGGGAATSFAVTGVKASGGITGLSAPLSAGAYAVVPGTIAPFPVTGGHGAGAAFNGVLWSTTVQLVRTFIGAAAGFIEPMTAPNTVAALYFNGVRQTGWSVDPTTGLVTLAAPFTSAQPAITTDFSYYFRCRFVSDAYEFENFMTRLWSLKKLDFMSVRP